MPICAFKVQVRSHGYITPVYGVYISVRGSRNLKVMGYSLLLRMRGVRLRFTVNSEMCARLWRQFFIAEASTLDWNSILQRKGQSGSKSFTEINILFMRYCAFYLPDKAKSKWLCGMNDHPSFFPTAAKRTRSEPPSSQLKTSHGCCQAGLLALSDCKI